MPIILSLYCSYQELYFILEAIAAPAISNLRTISGVAHLSDLHEPCQLASCLQDNQALLLHCSCPIRVNAQFVWPTQLFRLQIGNRIKSKGLQKLRWYCQMCQKQCRDENGFKCHLTSESHKRQMMVLGEDPERGILPLIPNSP